MTLSMTDIFEHFFDLDLILFPATYTYLELVNSNLMGPLMPSRAIGVLIDGHIASAITHRELPFTYFESFDSLIWLSILVSLLTIATILAIINTNVTSLFSFIWRYSAVLLSEPFPKMAYKRAINSLPQRIILVIWMLMCTVLLSAFAGKVTNF